MITAERVLRAYQRYDLYREWQSTLAARQAALFATPHRLDYALQVVSLLAVDKKRLFTQRCAQNKAAILAAVDRTQARCAQTQPLYPKHKHAFFLTRQHSYTRSSADETC